MKKHTVLPDKRSNIHNAHKDSINNAYSTHEKYSQEYPTSGLKIIISCPEIKIAVDSEELFTIIHKVFN